MFKSKKELALALHPANPFEDWDCNPDIVTLIPGYGGSSSFTTYGETEPAYLPDLNREQIKAHVADILIVTNSDSLMHLISEHATDYRRNYSTSVDAINDALQSFYGCESGSDKLDMLGEVYQWCGVVTLNTCVTGYSQGQYADLLIVASEEFLERTGCEISKPEDLQSYADLYASWAFGDVYGYTVTDNNGDDSDLSCWEFYGLDHGESGLLESATSEINAIIESIRKRHLAHTKSMIRNRVPLEGRKFKLPSGNILSYDSSHAGSPFIITYLTNPSRPEGIQGIWDHYASVTEIVPWYESIPEQGILCWVSDDYVEDKLIIAVIVSYRLRPFPYGGKTGECWKYATPITVKELREITYNHETE